MCPSKTVQRDKEIKAYLVVPSQITEIDLPDTIANLPQLGDFNPDNPNVLGYLIVMEDEDIYIFTNDEAYQDWLQLKMSS